MRKQDRGVTGEAGSKGGDGVEAIGCWVFETPLGPLGLAWRGNRVVRLQLPGRSVAETRRLLRAGLSGRGEDAATIPAWVRALARGIVRHLGGQPQDFRGVGLDLSSGTAFERRVWEALRGIGPGQTATYGEVARGLGRPGAARAVGGAVGRNPVALLVPCHRVVGSGGRLGGFSAPGGVDTKRRLLELEAKDKGRGIRE